MAINYQGYNQIGLSFFLLRALFVEFCHPSMSLCKASAFARLVVNPFRRTMLLVNKVMTPKNHAPCKQSYDPSVS